MVTTLWICFLGSPRGKLEMCDWVSSLESKNCRGHCLSVFYFRGLELQDWSGCEAQWSLKGKPFRRVQMKLCLPIFLAFSHLLSWMDCEHFSGASAPLTTSPSTWGLQRKWPPCFHSFYSLYVFIFLAQKYRGEFADYFAFPNHFFASPLPNSILLFGCFRCSAAHQFLLCFPVLKFRWSFLHLQILDLQGLSCSKGPQSWCLRKELRPRRLELCSSWQVFVCFEPVLLLLSRFSSNFDLI